MSAHFLRGIVISANLRNNSTTIAQTNIKTPWHKTTTRKQSSRERQRKQDEPGKSLTPVIHHPPRDREWAKNAVSSCRFKSQMFIVRGPNPGIVACFNLPNALFRFEAPRVWAHFAGFDPCDLSTGWLPLAEDSSFCKGHVHLCAHGRCTQQGAARTPGSRNPRARAHLVRGSSDVRNC